MAYYTASVSWGKDSLAMLLRLINENKQLDEVVFFDTGWNFKQYTMCVMLSLVC